MSDVTISQADVHSTEAAALLAELTADLSERYADDGGGAFLPGDVLTPGSTFMIAWVGEVAVGCGALRQMTDDIGEIKRMYVRPDYRGRGLAGRLLTALEQFAAQRGYRAVWLETGTKQPEAMHLYEKSGYHRIDCFGAHVDDPYSVCYEKLLAAANN